MHSQAREWSRPARPGPIHRIPALAQHLEGDASMGMTGSTASTDRLVSLSPGALYRVLLLEFERVRPPTCMSCRVPVPEPLDAGPGDAPNWWVRPCIPCPHGCDARIFDIVVAARGKYRVTMPARSGG
jgi:hypothetical protein